jgi:Schlafen, AlbA_2
MIPTPIDKIALADVERLIADAVPEGKDIEYKSILPGGTDADKKEFLADVSAFANTSGGDLVYGLEEAQGIPQKISALAIADVDLELRRLDNLIRDGIKPRLRYAVKVVTVPGDRKLLLIRVERSLIGPHRVTFQGHDKFYGRTSAGKYPLDVEELRTAFTLSQDTAERLRAFRVDRIISVSNNVMPVPLRFGAKVILHLLPLDAFGNPKSYDVLEYDRNPVLLRPIYDLGGWATRITFEGVLSYSGNPPASYTHLFRNGIIEAVETRLLNYVHEGSRFLPSLAYEHQLLKYLLFCFGIFKNLGVSAPIAVALTLTGVRGVEMSHDVSDGGDYFPIDTDTLTLPETVVENFDQSPESVLKPAFDLIWNACGQPASKNFDENGRWAPRRQ